MLLVAQPKWLHTKFSVDIIIGELISCIEGTVELKVTHEPKAMNDLISRYVRRRDQH